MDQKIGLFLILFLTAWLSSCTYRFYQADCDKPPPGNMVKQIRLDSTLAETSGLLNMDGLIWTFNDSGGEPALYCFDPSNGSIIRKTIISNATNVDWEDITEDSLYVYVADVGNRFAARDTLSIYRIEKSRLLPENLTVVHDGVISVSFDESIELNHKGYSSHDCEALFEFNDSLFLFSKDWVDETTSVYVIPSEPGHYNVKSSYRYEARILVTGADLHMDRNEVALVGYRNYLPIVITYNYTSDPGRITCGGKARIYPLKLGRQVEGICFGPKGDIYISAERSFQKQSLFKLAGSVH